MTNILILTWYLANEKKNARQSRQKNEIVLHGEKEGTADPRNHRTGSFSQNPKVRKRMHERIDAALGAPLVVIMSEWYN